MLESRENYLYTIYSLKEQNGVVHSVDVAKELGYSKPSVSRAIGILKESGCIETAKGGAITLTTAGNKAAKEFSAKVDMIQKFLMYTADVDGKVAKEDAVRMAHDIQKKTYQGIVRFVKMVEEQ
ncbi:MAG: metal-dependent transcriptional regulator [Lachnospiraceae bacterium]|nr:metal-dependent transcriptional regulator [Lachnospiraceae bacterium]